MCTSKRADKKAEKKSNENCQVMGILAAAKTQTLSRETHERPSGGRGLG